jgi:very-short-patch-repair endonuclease
VEFFLLCERFGLPAPRMNVWIGRKKVDALWSDAGLVVELDGKTAHGTAARHLADRQRDLELRALGYRVRRYSWHQVFNRPDEVVADLRAALANPR